MKILVEAPHKVLFSGSYTVLEGYPALAFAIEPRMTLILTSTDEPDPWSTKNPFIQAVREELREYMLQRHTEAEVNALSWGQFHTSVSMPVEGWGIGSSAAFTSALTFAQTEAWGVGLSSLELSFLARSAHRRAQGGKGSGLDVAACCLGGVVFAAQSGGDTQPNLTSVDWPEEIGFILIRSGQKADTRKMIARYHESTQHKPLLSRRHLLRSIGGVCRALRQQPNDFLPALQENCMCEREWSKELGISLVTPYQTQLEQALQERIQNQQVVVKALGAGGGDSIGLFYDTRQVTVTDLVLTLHDFPLQARPTTIQQQGTVRGAAT